VILRGGPWVPEHIADIPPGPCSHGQWQCDGSLIRCENLGAAELIPTDREGICNVLYFCSRHGGASVSLSGHGRARLSISVA
jgi:hypothetical protein